MGRWLPKEEREKRDGKVIELYQSGLAYRAISERLGLSGCGAISEILDRHGIVKKRGVKKE